MRRAPLDAEVISNIFVVLPNCASHRLRGYSPAGTEPSLQYNIQGSSADEWQGPDSRDRSRQESGVALFAALQVAELSVGTCVAWLPPVGKDGPAQEVAFSLIAAGARACYALGHG
jgi:hypothetical protein